MTGAGATSAGSTSSVARGIRSLVRRPEASILLVMLALGAFLSVANPRFLALDNFMNIAKNYSDIAIGAVGMTLVLIIGGIDLSVASVMALGGLVAAIAMTSWGLPIPIAILLGVGAGATIGLINGLLIQRLRLPPFIATLGMLGVARGIVVGTTSGQGVSGLPKEFTAIGQGYVGPVPVPVVVLVVVAIVVGLFLAYHLWGTYIFSIGGNETAAILTGLPVARVKIFVYVLCGLLAGLAGVVTVSRFGVSLPGQSLGYELQVDRRGRDRRGQPDRWPGHGPGRRARRDDHRAHPERAGAAPGAAVLATGLHRRNHHLRRRRGHRPTATGISMTIVTRGRRCP